MNKHFRKRCKFTVIIYCASLIYTSKLDNFTLEYNAPDIGDSSSPELYVKWMKGDNKPTKTILAEFE